MENEPEMNDEDITSFVPKITRRFIVCDSDTDDEELIFTEKIGNYNVEKMEKNTSELNNGVNVSFVPKTTQKLIIEEDNMELIIEEDNAKIDNIVENSYIELNNIMNNWCKNYDENFSGGKMRGDRGEDIENFVKFVINMFISEYDLNACAVKGTDDKKELKIPGTEIKKDHQVDIHIYKNDIFIAVIECKSYLDSCYYTRACDDFKLFKKFGYDIKKYIFALEDSIKEETKLFTDYETDNVCDDIFYMLDKKRCSNKPIYNKEYKKNINKDKLTYFVKSLKKLLINI
jgi:hypothetical protein